MLAPRHLRTLLDLSGGFTLDPASGRPVERGVSVCLDPQLAVSFRRSAWRDDVVVDWLAARAVELERPRRFVGGWFDRASDHVWLDVVRVLPSVARPAAVVLARRRGQHCVYDLARRRLVPTAGAAV